MNKIKTLTIAALFATLPIDAMATAEQLVGELLGGTASLAGKAGGAVVMLVKPSEIGNPKAYEDPNSTEYRDRVEQERQQAVLQNEIFRTYQRLEQKDLSEE